MPKHLIEAGAGRPLLDIGSYARRGPGQRVHLSREEIDLIRRTVTRTPEVVVKVLTRGGQNLKAVRAHVEYLNRGGELEIESDHGERLAGKDVAARLVTDWDLDVEEFRRRSELRSKKDRAPPKLIQKILFSMPPGTPPKKVLAAVKNFAREEFGLAHRYAMVLHTDEPHPHVHVVVKAVSERGERLNIRKATLRRWRGEFGEQLRRQGVAANATERPVRGVTRRRMSDGLYRASRRSDFRVIRDLVMSRPGREPSGLPQPEPRGAASRRTREAVQQGWVGASDILLGIGETELARRVRSFAQSLPTIPRSGETQSVRGPQILCDRDSPHSRG